MNTLLRHTLVLFVFVSAASAADRIPKEMRPKLVREGKVLVDEKFEEPVLSKKWLTPAGESAGSVKMENGVAVIEAGAGRQGAIWQRLEPGVTDASVQLLMKPWATPWMGIRFMVPNADEERQWAICAIIYDTGFVRVAIPDGKQNKQNKLIKAAKVKLTKDDWWRVLVESKGDHYVVRINGDEVIDLKHDNAKGEKMGVMVNLYGGKGSVDEIKVMSGK